MAGTRQCKVLNVAEKNDAAKELAKIMSKGRFQRREGYSKFNKIYEFDLHMLGKECRMVMTSVSGHLLSLDFILAYKNWRNCAPGSLFSADIRWFCPENYVPIKRTLEREIRGCQYLILWTDGDREGENIADEIFHVCSQVKSRIQVHRARFSEITTQSIMRACSNLGTLDQMVSDAVKARQELDLRIGCAFTRFQTMRLRKSFPHILEGQLVSYGPCQFPTLGFVVERYKQVQAFIPESFHKIKVTHDSDDGKVEFNWKRVRVFNHTMCLVLYQMCLENPTAQVINTQSRPKSKWRPLPLDTVELEKQASKKLRISAKETMRIAEKLYTQGYISYPRTETNIFPDSFDLPAIIQDQTPDPNWGAFASQLLVRGPTPRRGNKTDSAHPPIHPTKYSSNLQGDEKRIYEYVVRHFLACCSQDAQGQETTVDIDIAGEKFAAQGLMITARNYLDVFPYDRWSAKTIPVYQVHSTFQPTSIEMLEGETTPPPLLHEADLIALMDKHGIADLITFMDKHGIGTDATHAEHIETIKSRNYVGVQGDGSFVPGELGMGLVEGYDSMGYELSKPKLRAELEADLKRICEGRKSKEEVLSVTVEKYKEVFLNANRQAHKLEEALSKYFGAPQPVTADEPPRMSEVVRKCPICQQCNIVVKKKKDGGYMLSCLGFPECRAVQFFPQCIADVAVHESHCDTCQPQPVRKLKFKFKPGSVPAYLGLEHTGCSTCDDALRNDLEFRPIRSTNPSTNDSTMTGSSQSHGQSRSRTGTSSTRGGAQRGHGGTSRRGRGSSSQQGMGQSTGRGNWDHGPGGGATGPEVARGGSQPVTNSHTSFGYGSGYNLAGPTSDSSNPPVCTCGELAVQLTVRKEGANTGRQFYKCNRRDGGCDFFLWADQADMGGGGGAARGGGAGGGMHTSYGFAPPPTSSPWQGQSRQDYYSSRQPGPSTGQRSRGQGQSQSSGGSSSCVMCGCGLQAVQRTVQKDGPNKGKLFYTCSKPREEQCGFFEWANDVPASHIHSGSRRGRGGGGGWDLSSAGPSTRKKRAPPTCSVCREVGHTKRSCPQARGN